MSIAPHSLPQLALLPVLLACAALVGAEPIAPFPMPDLPRPVFPDRIVSITGHGAVPGGEKLNADEIQRAIDACAAAGGGTVLVPAGRWLTAPIELRSRINLHLAAGAELIFTDEKKYYYPGFGVFTTPPRLASQSYVPSLADTYYPRPLISAYDSEHIAITGPGRIDGQGLYWWALHKAWFKKRGHDHYAAADIARCWRGLDPAADYLRPCTIQFDRCRNLLFEGFTVVNSPFWTINPVACENIVARNLTLLAARPGPRPHSPNTDGINPESCRNVLIEDCLIETGDDAVAIKSGLDEAGRKRGLPSENIVIRRLRGKRLALGSEMSGGIRNVFIHDCELKGGMDTILHIKTRRGRGNVVENIWVQDITAGQVNDAIIQIDMEYWTEVNPAALEPLSERTPRFRNFTIRNIRSLAPSPGAVALYLNGLPEMSVENLHFENLQLDAPHGMVIRHARGITFRNVTLTGTAGGPVISLGNVQDITFRNFTAPAGVTPFLQLDSAASRNIRFDASLADRSEHIVYEDGATPAAVSFASPVLKD